MLIIGFKSTRTNKDINILTTKPIIGNLFLFCVTNYRTVKSNISLTLSAIYNSLSLAD